MSIRSNEIARIENDHVDANIARWLARQEEALTKKEFFNCLRQEQADNPDVFFCASMNVCDTEYAFVVTEHPFKRMWTRSAWGRQDAKKRAAQLLANSMIGSEVISHPVYFDDDGRTLTSEDGIKYTDVVDEATQYVFCYQSGFGYIRLATMWDCSRGIFFAHPQAAVIKLRSDGFVESNRTNIEEVGISELRKKRKK